MDSLQEEGPCVVTVPAAGKESENENELEQGREGCSWDEVIVRLCTICLEARSPKLSPAGIGATEDTDNTVSPAPRGAVEKFRVSGGPLG